MFLAGIDLFLSEAGLTLDVTAPADLAVAGEGGEAEGRVVAPSAAQAAAAGVLWTRSAGRPGGVARWPAKAGWLLQKYQLGWPQTGTCVAVASWACQLGLSSGGVGNTMHSNGRVIAVLQQMACVLKRGELLPACSHSTRTGDTVTLTSSLKTTLHRLRRNEKTEVKTWTCQIQHYDPVKMKQKLRNLRRGRDDSIWDAEVWSHFMHWIWPFHMDIWYWRRF